MGKAPFIIPYERRETEQFKVWAIFLEVKSEFKGGVKDAVRRDVLQSHSVNEAMLRRMMLKMKQYGMDIE